MDQSQEAEGNDPNPIGNHKAVIAMDENDFRLLVVLLFRQGKERMDDHQKLIEENTRMTKANLENTAQLVEIFQGAKTGAATFSWIGRNLRRLISFLYPFILCGGALLALWHGKFPKIGE